MTVGKFALAFTTVALLSDLILWYVGGPWWPLLIIVACFPINLMGLRIEADERDLSVPEHVLSWSR